MCEHSTIMDAGSGAAVPGSLETAPKIQMMKDLLTSMGVEEADPKVCLFPCLRMSPLQSRDSRHCIMSTVATEKLARIWSVLRSIASVLS